MDKSSRNLTKQNNETYKPLYLNYACIKTNYPNLFMLDAPELTRSGRTTEIKKMDAVGNVFLCFLHTTLISDYKNFQYKF